MVTFESLANAPVTGFWKKALAVKVHGVLFGYIHKTEHFFTSPEIITGRIALSLEDLDSIRSKIQELIAEG